MPAHIRTSQEMCPAVDAHLDREEIKKAFCARRDFPESVVTYWIKKYHRERATGFLEIAPPIRSKATVYMEIIRRGGTRLRFFAAVEPACLERLLVAAAA